MQWSTFKRVTLTNFAKNGHRLKRYLALITLTSHLDVVANAVRPTHLEEDAVMDDGKIRVEQLRTHHCVALRVEWLSGQRRGLLVNCAQNTMYVYSRA